MNFSYLQKLLLILSIATNICYGQFNTDIKLPTAPDVIIKELPNGITYYIRKNSKPENKVELRLVVKAGSIIEDDDQQGLAHFVEHMAFNGTKHFKKNELVSFLQSIGIKFGSDLNAYTSFDETVYILPIPLDNPENLEKGLLVLEDWASNISFDSEEIEKERGVVLEEERSGKGANQRMMDKALPHILRDSKFAKRLPIGKTEILKSFSQETIMNFYKDWYRPNLMSVIIVGDIDTEIAEAKIKQHFGHLRNPPKERERKYENIPPYHHTEGLVISDKEATHHVLQILYSPTKSKMDSTLGDYRNSTIRQIVLQLMGNRLKELTQKAEPMFIYGGIQLGSFLGGFENFSGYAVVGNAGVQKAIEAIVIEQVRAKKFGFTNSELERVKKSNLRSYEQFYNERNKTESTVLVAELVRNFLNGEAIPGIENEYNYQKIFIPLLTVEEINAVAKNIIPNGNEPKMVVLMGPDKAEFSIPKNDELITLMSEAEKLPITPYEEKVLAEKLMSNVPESGTIVDIAKNGELNIVELTLSNGVKVVLKHTEFKNDQVTFSGFRHGGTSLFDDVDLQNAQYSTRIVSQMGVGDFSPTDLKKFLAGKSVFVAPSINMTSERISGNSGVEELEIMLQLVHLYFTKPRKDEELFKSFISKQKDFTNNLKSNPEYVFNDTILSTLYNNHIRAPHIPNPKDFESIDLNRTLEIYQDRFGNAQGWTFFFVGNFEQSNINLLIKKYIASLPSFERHNSSFIDRGLRPVSGVIKKDIYVGKDSKSKVSLYFTGKAEYSEIDNLKISTLSEIINIKLIETLREELSSIYSGGMSGSLSKYPYPNYIIKISLPCGPENVDKIINATFKEIQSIIENGPTTIDLHKVKEGFSKKYDEGIKENSYWLSSLNHCYEYGLNPNIILNRKSQVEGITISDIKNTAKEYFNVKNYFQAVKYPEK